MHTDITHITRDAITETWITNINKLSAGLQVKARCINPTKGTASVPESCQKNNTSPPKPCYVIVFSLCHTLKSDICHCVVGVLRVLQVCMRDTFKYRDPRANVGLEGLKKGSWRLPDIPASASETGSADSFRLLSSTCPSDALRKGFALKRWACFVLSC